VHQVMQKELFDLYNLIFGVETWLHFEGPQPLIKNTAMELSKYTLPLEHQRGLFIYNSLSNCLIKVDKELFDYFKSNNEINCYSIDDKHNEVISELKKALFIIDHHNDDLLQYMNVSWGRRQTEDVYNITIAPTMDCNYHCYYCFESPSKTFMTDEILERIAHYISNLKNARIINLTWFGGEPLLAKNQIIELSNKIQLSKETNFSSTIITNGYYLDRDFVNILPELNIDNLQITIDGLYDGYNRVKSMTSDKNCFNRILYNIDYFAEHQKDISLHLRVNMDKTSMDDFHRIATFFKERYPNNTNIYCYPAFLKNINNTSSKSNACNYCNIEDQICFSLSMFDKTSDKKYLYPKNEFNECAIRNRNSWAFGPDGSVYKCWENIGNVDHKVGVIDVDGNIQITDNEKLLRYYFGADPLYADDCKECFYLPICHGRCPHQRIQEESGVANRQSCMKDTNCINRYLEKLIENLSL